MTVFRWVILASGYFAAGWFGLRIPFIGQSITLVWLPTGIAVAALLRWGGQMWPAIYLGALAVNLSIGSAWPLAASIAVGNALGPTLTAWLLQRIGFRNAMEHQGDVWWFAAMACIGMTVSASGGVLSLYLAGALPAAFVPSAWLTWWMGDTIGVLLAGPLLLTLNRRNLQTLQHAWWEILTWFLIAGPIGWLAFLHDFTGQDRTLPLAFMTLPLVAWAAMRFGMTGGAVSALLFSVLAAVCTAMGHGTFFLTDEKISRLLLWSYMSTAVLTGLVITAMQSERRGALRELRDSTEKLRGLFEMSPLGIALTDMSGRFIEFNEAFRRITGYTADELKRLDYWELTPKEYDAQEAEQLKLLDTQQRYGPYEKEYRRKDGRLIPLRLNGTLLTDSANQRYIWSIVEDISESKANQQRLEALLAEQRAMLESGVVGIAKTHETKVLWANGAYERMLGYSPGELAGTPAEMILGNPDAHQTFLTQVLPILNSGKIYHGSARQVRKNGEQIWVDISGALLDAKEGTTLWALVDVTERKLAEHKLRESEHRYDQLVKHIPDGVYTWQFRADKSMGFTYVSERFCKLIGVDEPTLLLDGMQGFKNVHPDDLQAFLRDNEQASLTLQPLRVEYRFIVDLQTRWLRIWSDPTILKGGGSEWHGVVSDITEQKRAEHAMERMAQIDMLTGIANRHHFMTLAEQELARCLRYGGELSVFMLDIDRFKRVNDSHGHQVGDKVIQQLGQLLRESLRSIDIPGRVGGEEFAVILPQTGMPQAIEVAARLRQDIDACEIQLQSGVPLRFTVSIGIASVPQAQINLDTLLSYADQALYAAKHGGRDCVYVYESGTGKQGVHRSLPLLN